jgi:hypothetical protein
MSLWSRKFFPKVFGGFFLTALSGIAFASAKEEAAIRASGKALFIYSGAKRKADELSKVAQGEIKSTLVEQNILEEAIVIGITAKILSEKRLNFEYHGNHFVITPRSVEVKIPF